MKEPKGYLMLVLHAHLPFVRHPEYEDFLEERWLYEAITETYIPLINMFEGLVQDGVDFRITMSLTPPLISMLTDDLLQQRYLKHIKLLIELAEKEVERTKWLPEFNKVSMMYLNKFRLCREIFEDRYKNNIVAAFKKFQEMGKLEILTCGATHGFMPLLSSNMSSVKAQIKTAVEHYKEHIGRQPKGIWNGECGYYPGLDDVLKENGIRYFFVDTHGILFANRRPKYGIFAPIYCPSGVAAFGRDVESSKSVWSANEGYPGDYNYREFYRDIGYDLEFDYIKPYIHESGLRVCTGIKYHKITAKGIGLGEKQVYDPDIALKKTADHAGNFMFNREKQIENLAELMDRQPVIVSPYDAELFGHWWYEGPDFLNYLLRKIHYDQNTIKTITPSEYLAKYPNNQVAVPAFSSWGHKGYCEVWLEGSNDWIYRHLHKAAERMEELAKSYPEATGILRRALNQAARELLLAQSSDWAFIMKTQTMVGYAVKRTKDHINRFISLYEMIKSSNIDEKYLSDLEYRDNIFPNIDYSIYGK